MILNFPNLCKSAENFIFLVKNLTQVCQKHKDFSVREKKYKLKFQITKEKFGKTKIKTFILGENGE